MKSKGILTLRWAVVLAFLFLALPGQAAPRVILTDLEGVVGTAMESHLDEVFQIARDQSVDLLILRLDTPGGLVSSMQAMTGKILNSSVPVVVWVAPSGARAASAGAFLVQSAAVAVMASGTHVGAAHPVGASGDLAEGDLKKKVTNDLAAQMRSLASERGRNAGTAAKMVTESLSLTSSEALEAGVIDLVADETEHLLAALEGRQVKVGGQVVRLALEGAVVEEMPPSQRLRILAFLTRPDVAYLLLMMGIYAIIFEVLTPGGFVMGTAGAVMVLMGAYGLRMLPFNWAGIVLLIAGIAVMILDLVVGGMGILSLFGVAALILGGLVTFRGAPGGELLRVSMGVLGGAIAALSLLFALAAFAVWRSLRRRAVSGREGLVGARGEVKSDLLPEGMILCRGELWRARSSDGTPVPVGSVVKVVKVEGLLLTVEPVEKGNNS